MTKVIKYGLRRKKNGKILGYRSESNDGRDFCGDKTYSLSLSGENMWLVDTPYQAEYVRVYNTPWFNAGYATPENEYDANDLEVVEVEVVTKVVPVSVKVPTMKEYLKVKYEKEDPAHYRYTLKEVKAHPDFFYTWYDLSEILRKEQWR